MNEKLSHWTSSGNRNQDIQESIKNKILTFTHIYDIF